MAIYTLLLGIESFLAYLNKCIKCISCRYSIIYFENKNIAFHPLVIKLGLAYSKYTACVANIIGILLAKKNKKQAKVRANSQSN